MKSGMSFDESNQVAGIPASDDSDHTDWTISRRLKGQTTVLLPAMFLCYNCSACIKWSCATTVVHV